MTPAGTGYCWGPGDHPRGKHSLELTGKELRS